MRAKNRKSIYTTDHGYATFARVLLGAAGVTAALLFMRSLPDLVRYVKMERM